MCVSFVSSSSDVWQTYVPTFLLNSSPIRRLRRQKSQSKLPAHVFVTTGVDMLGKDDGGDVKEQIKLLGETMMCCLAVMVVEIIIILIQDVPVVFCRWLMAKLAANRF